MEVGLVALWLVVFLLLGLVALPFAAWLFGRAHAEADDGFDARMDDAALAIPLAVVVLSVVGYLVGQVAFGWPAALAGVTALFGASLLASGRVAVDWRAFGESATVFTAAFLLVVAVRAVDPAAAPLPLAIGEKFLDFGLLRSLERTSALPPTDMWFAGRPVRYYYGGHMTATLLGTLTDTGSRYAYNLALAGFYATLVTGAYGLAGSIAAPYGISRRVAAVIGAFLVGIAGNLEPAAQVVAWALPDAVTARIAGAVSVDSVPGWTPAEFWYFDASRVIPVDPSNSDSIAAATEFPLFSWLNGDLHAHMMSQPILLLAGALLLAYWRCRPDRRRRRGALLFGALPPVVGFVAVTNVWSFPTAAGLTLLTVLFAPGDPTDLLPGDDTALGRLRARLDPSATDTWLVDEFRRIGLAVGAAVAVLGLAIAWTLPFWTGVVLGGPGKSVALWTDWTPLGALLLVHGAFLAPFALYLARRLVVRYDRPRLAVGLGAAVLVGSVLIGFPALGLVAPIGLAAWWLLQTRADAGSDGDDERVGFETVLLLAGAGLVVLVELVTVEGERFNVIFKTYSDVWLFWGVAGGVVLARLVDGWPATTLGADRRRVRWTGRALVVAVVLFTSVYAGLALPAHFDAASPTADAEGPTMDATAYLEVEYAGEAPAIRWLDEREGQPVLVTAAPGGYRWSAAEGRGASAPATLSGLPTVLGWFHEAQYRGQTPYQERLDHVQTIYTGNAANQARLLDRHDVRYVYVGPAERATYGTVTVDERPWTTVANDWEQVTIYRVNRSALR
jgi:YYY domain-containing protein